MQMIEQLHKEFQELIDSPTQRSMGHIFHERTKDRIWDMQVHFSLQ